MKYLNGTSNYVLLVRGTNLQQNDVTILTMEGLDEKWSSRYVFLLSNDVRVARTSHILPYYKMSSWLYP